jgi:16S rRNA (guanine966-N2)-methyltransferase
MASRNGRASGQLRIIGGAWRGRKLRFPATAGLRPTPDRVRETLFNWLAVEIPGARCLDLFAGSGALGLEALSRGASYCGFVDRQAENVQAIKDHLAVLGCNSASTTRGDALSLLASGNPNTPYDLVFLDPPFGTALLNEACASLTTGGWLAERACIYAESGIRDDLQAPAEWHLHRDKTAGDVHYQLFVRGDQFV